MNRIILRNYLINWRIHWNNNHKPLFFLIFLYYLGIIKKFRNYHLIFSLHLLFGRNITRRKYCYKVFFYPFWSLLINLSFLLSYLIWLWIYFWKISRMQFLWIIQCLNTTMWIKKCFRLGTKVIKYKIWRNLKINI